NYFQNDSVKGFCFSAHSLFGELVQSLGRRPVFDTSVCPDGARECDRQKVRLHSCRAYVLPDLSLGAQNLSGRSDRASIITFFRACTKIRVRGYFLFSSLRICLFLPCRV